METYHLIALMIMPLIIVAVIFCSPQAAPTFFKPPSVAADPPPIYHQKCQQLWIYTQPVEKGPCVVFHIPNQQKANQDNILWNKGLLAAQHSSLIKCPSSDKSFCDGWQYQKTYLK